MQFLRFSVRTGATWRSTPRAYGAALLLLGALLVPAAAPSQTLTLNLKDADISAVISTVSEITGRNFIVDPRVKGKVTVISSRPLEADEVYQVFLSILNVHGFAAVPGPNAIKIVPEVNAKQSEIANSTPRRPGEGDEYVTRVIQVQNVAAAQLVPILRPLLPQQGHLAAYPPSNVLIASATAANVQRLVDIINRIDTATDSEVEVIPLQHASADEVVRILTTLSQQTAKGQQAAPGETPNLVADMRTNSVLLSGEKQSRLQLRSIIAHLDTPLQRTGNTEVVYLRYANAKELVPVLTGLGQELAAGDPKAAQQQAAAARAKGNVNIQADENTNALVISAPPDIMRDLLAIVRKLDIRRAQVMVEAVIAEVSTNTTKELGVQWAYDGSESGAPVGLVNFAGTGSGLLNLLADPPQISDGLSLALGDTSDDGGTRAGALIRALAADGDTNILSTPTLVTMDNEEAEIVVGQNVPFVTGSYTSTGGGSTPDNPFQTIQREDVGLTLKVRPQINEGNAIKLVIQQEVSSISAGTTGASDIITNKRSINTTVIVDSGDAVVLGGLIDDQLRESVQKVPGLGDIPLLGWLFTYKQTTKEKRNLMVFIRPIILRDASHNAAVSGEKYNYMRAAQLAVREDGVNLMPEAVSPLLPRLEDWMTLPPPFEETQSGMDTPPLLEAPAPEGEVDGG